VLQVIQKSPAIEQLISHALPRSRIQDAFDLLTSGECGKVVLQPWP
jgi:hypothetical protein